MHPPDVVADALARLAAGASASEVARATGLNRRTVADWSRGAVPRQRPDRRCFRCEGSTAPDPAAYAHLLGLYLGDGCLSRHQEKDLFSLRITCADEYPGLIQECAQAVTSVRPGPVQRVAKQGCTDVQAWWKHWPCLFPQHGPGRKHERTIALEQWQRTMVEQHPGRFLRGLFHSDGTRITNWATKRLPDGTVRRYEGYPRYFFSNRSEDLLSLCTWALDLLGVRWTRPNPQHVSVARREAVAVLDQHVGPKH